MQKSETWKPTPAKSLTFAVGQDDFCKRSNVFTAWFDADLIDLDYDKEIKTAAGICASDLNKQIKDLSKLILELQEVVDSWRPEVVMLFINAARTDWLADEELESSLKHILLEIIKGLKYFQQSRS